MQPWHWTFSQTFSPWEFKKQTPQEWNADAEISASLKIMAQLKAFSLKDINRWKKNILPHSKYGRSGILARFCQNFKTTFYCINLFFLLLISNPKEIKSIKLFSKLPYGKVTTCVLVLASLSMFSAQIKVGWCFREQVMAPDYNAMTTRKLFFNSS